MVLAMFTAHLYGVFQSLVVASPARTVRWRLALVAFLAGITVSAPAALLLQFGWTRLFALITHQSLFDVVGVAAYSLDPFIEEIIKPLPLVLACMIPWVRRQLGITDIVIICLALGSGFGMAENLLRFSDVAGKAISTDNGVWIVPGGIFSAIAIPDIGKSLLSWIPEGAGNISILDMQDNMVVTNMHLAWSALAGLGIGIVLRQRQPWKWATLLLILLVSLDHAAYNTPETVASDNLNFKILTAFFGFLDKGMWLYPLVALGVAIWLDRRAMRAALRDVPAVYFPAERQGAFGLLEVALKLGSKPWSTIRLWSFVLQRRAFALHKALAPHEEPLRTMYNQLVATRIVLERNQPIAPPAFIAFFSRHGKSSAGMLKSWLLKKLTLQRAFLLLLSLPLILYFIIGSFPPFAWVQKLLENQVVFLFLMLLLGVSVIWQIVRLALSIRQLPQVLKRFNGQIITIHFFSILMAFGALLMAAGTVASFLQGNGPTDRAISSYHVLDALGNALLLTMLLLGLMAMFFPPGGLVLAVAGMEGIEILSADAAAAIIATAGRGAVVAGVGGLIAKMEGNAPDDWGGDGGSSGGEPPATKPHADPSQIQDEGLRSTGQKASNAVNNHLKPDDLKGAWRDLHGDPVPHPNGGYWNHLDEVNNAQNSIRNMVNQYKERLAKDPNLSSNDRAIMQDMVSKGSKTLEYIKKVLGRDEWVDGTQIPSW